MPDRTSPGSSSDAALAERLDALGESLRAREPADPPASLLDAAEARRFRIARVRPAWLALAAALGIVAVGVVISASIPRSSPKVVVRSAEPGTSPSAAAPTSVGAIAGRNRQAPAGELVLPPANAIGVGVGQSPRASDIRTGRAADFLQR